MKYADEYTIHTTRQNKNILTKHVLRAKKKKMKHSSDEDENNKIYNGNYCVIKDKLECTYVREEKEKKKPERKQVERK